MAECGVGNNLNNLLVAEGASNYTLVAGTGNDVMIGNGSGDAQYDTGAGSTTFVIAKGDGNDVIANFRNSVDVVRLNNFVNLTSLAAVQAAMTQVGTDVVLNLGSGQTLTFRNETIANFHANDFSLPANLPGMSLRFDDEFNSFVSSPTGTQGWMTQGGAYWRTLSSNNEAEYYSDSSVGVNPFSDSNGVLTITAAPGSNPLGLPYKSGIITTEKSFNFEYGLVEVSAKLPAGNGLWPAIWLLPSSLGWPPEIDIMEMLGGDPTTIYVSTHSGATNISSRSSGLCRRHHTVVPHLWARLGAEHDHLVFRRQRGPHRGDAIGHASADVSADQSCRWRQRQLAWRANQRVRIPGTDVDQLRADLRFVQHCRCLRHGCHGALGASHDCRRYADIGFEHLWLQPHRCRCCNHAGQWELGHGKHGYIDRNVQFRSDGGWRHADAGAE